MTAIHQTNSRDHRGETKGIQWPSASSVEKFYPLDDKCRVVTLTLIEDIQDSAEERSDDIKQCAQRLTEIYKKALGELPADHENAWLFDPAKIIEKVKRGNCKFAGYYVQAKLIGATLFTMNREQGSLQCGQVVMDLDDKIPEMQKWVSKFNDSITEKSGAEMVYARV